MPLLLLLLLPGGAVRINRWLNVTTGFRLLQPDSSEQVPIHCIQCTNDFTMLEFVVDRMGYDQRLSCDRWVRILEAETLDPGF